MKRTPIRAIVAIASSLAAIALSACGGDGGPTQPTVTVASASSSTSSSAAATSSTSINDPAAQKPGYDLVFDENFDTLSVSASGPNTTWTAHTPWNGDFGDAAFANPTSDFPFTVQNGILRIEARQDANGNWQSGLLSSVDPSGNGFAQQYGYWEMRAKLPPGAGVWPAFWLNSVMPAGTTDFGLEVDALEYYGQFNNAYRSSYHIYPVDGSTGTGASVPISVPADSLTSDFHVYGVSIEPDWIIYYLDGVETYKVATPVGYNHKEMILIDLALGGGWPITTTPNPSYMYVDYVRAYKLTGT